MGELPAINVPVVHVPIDEERDWWGASAGPLHAYVITADHPEITAELIVDRGVLNLTLVDGEGVIRARAVQWL